MKKSVALLMSLALGALPAVATAAEKPLARLRRNPFQHPQIHRSTPQNASDGRSDSSLTEFGPEDIELRTTLVARDGSLANLNGVILAPGEAIGPYRLVQVNEDDVMLIRNGKKIVVTADGNE